MYVPLIRIEGRDYSDDDAYHCEQGVYYVVIENSLLSHFIPVLTHIRKYVSKSFGQDSYESCETRFRNCRCLDTLRIAKQYAILI